MYTKIVRQNVKRYEENFIICNRIGKDRRGQEWRGLDWRGQERRGKHIRG
jgi:hypothetical protein